MARNPCTERRPFVVPESARIVSQAWMSVTRDGRPAADPSGMTPFFAASISTSSTGEKGTPFVSMPALAVSGPRADILAPMVV